MKFGNIEKRKAKTIGYVKCRSRIKKIAKSITEILWLNKLLSKLGFTPQKSCRLYCDDKATISISENTVQHDRNKYVEIEKHFIKDHLDGK